MAFGTVLMKPQLHIPFGSRLAFGHDGAGEALAYADPMYDLAFGYAPQRMAYPEGPNQKRVLLSALVRSLIAGA